MKRRHRIARALMLAGLAWAAMYQARAQHWYFAAGCVVLMLYWIFIYDETRQ